MKRLFTYKSLLSLAVLGAIVATYFVPELGALLLTGGAGAGGSMLAGNITGPLTVDKIKTDNSDHLRVSMSKIVTEIKPDEFPLDTFIRSLGKTEKAIDWKHNYQTVTYRPFSDTSDGAFTAAGNATDESVDLGVDNVDMWEIDDTLRVDGVTNNSGEELRCIVTNKSSSGGTITITAINGNTGQRVLSIDDETTLYRMAPAKSELDAQHTSNLQIPANDYNYCQKFMTQMERSVYEKLTQSRSGFNYADQKRIALYNFRSACEASHLFGVRAESTVGNDKVYTAGGVIPKISQSIEFGSGGGSVDPSVNNALDALEAVFAGQAGSDTRVLLAGKSLITGLSKISNYDRNLQFNGNKIVHGVKVTELESGFGTVYVKHHKSLDQQGWSSKGVFLDLENIVKAEFKPLSATPLKLKEAGTRDVEDAVRIDETACLTTRYASASGVHAIWTPKLST
jgi:hypothetical protein